MSDRVLGVACVVVAAGMAWAAQDYAPPFSYEPVGPRAFPRLLAGLLALAGLWLAFKPTLDGSAFRVAGIRSVALCALAVVVYASLFQTLGFPVATAAMSVPIGMAFGGTWKQSLIAGIGLGLGLYFLFDKLLDVVLPTGLLRFLLGGR
ncbi:MAG: tripartite tricarboxylate transporter TctB family protein [Variovorax sp.]